MIPDKHICLISAYVKHMNVCRTHTEKTDPLIFTTPVRSLAPTSSQVRLPSTPEIYPFDQAQRISGSARGSHASRRRNVSIPQGFR